MADTAPSTSHNGGIPPPPPNKMAAGEDTGGSSSSSSSSNMANKQGVKKLLERYNMTAGMTLTGPANSSLEDPPYKRHHSLQREPCSPPPLSLAPPPPPPSYKLPADIELSKTEDGDGMEDDVEDISSASAHNHKNRIMMGMLHGHQQQQHQQTHPPPPPPPPPPRFYGDKVPNGGGVGDVAEGEAKAALVNGGGRVTLSRLDTRSPTYRDEYGRLGYGAVRRQRYGSQESPHHLHQQQQQPHGADYQHSPRAPMQEVQNRHQNHLEDKYRQQQQQFKRPDDHPSANAVSTHATTTTTMPPLLSTPRDRGPSEISETLLCGEAISCFSVGGEFRLCLPQILNTVLDSVSLHAIHQGCDELQIYCSTCSPAQLEALKARKILPITAYQCGLITKSDAERLCAGLLERNPPRASLAGFNAKASPFSFKVEHECFGKCVGILLPEAAINAESRCVECLECEGLFSPHKFVCHSHVAENRTCHWGFDSAHWRSYLHLWEGYSEEQRDKLERRFSDFKNRFSANGQMKRKLLEETSSTSSSSSMLAMVKKPRLSSEGSSTGSGGPGVLLPPPPPGALPLPPPPPTHTTPEQYGAYLYNMAVATKNPAMAAWAANFANAIKEGKTPVIPGLQFQSGSSSSHNGGQPRPAPQRQQHPAVAKASPPGALPIHHRGPPPPPGYIPSTSSRRSPGAPPPLVINSSVSGGGSAGTSGNGRTSSSATGSTNSLKSSPIDLVDSPVAMSATGGNGMHRVHDPGFSPSPGSSSSSSTSTAALMKSRTSLADDINAIKNALEGASVTAREKTLKILERLTARLALAEGERDTAMSQLNSLQKRYRSVEDELSKKRAELRELLRQESSSSSSIAAPPPIPPSSPGMSSSGGGKIHITPGISSSQSGRNPQPHHPVPGTSLPPGPPSGEIMHRGSMMDLITESAEFRHRRERSSTLPKVELKSPSQVMAESQNMSTSSSSSSSHLAPPLIPSCRSAAGSAHERPRSSGAGQRPGTAGSAWSTPGSGMVREHSPNPGIGMVSLARVQGDHEAMSNHSGSTVRHRSGDRGGTPNSVKSTKSSDQDVLDRMVSMEAELRQLRRELQDSSRKRRASGDTTGSTPAPSESAASVAATDQNGGLNEDESPSVVPETANPPSEIPVKSDGGGQKDSNGDEGNKDNNGGEGSSMAVDER